MNKNKKKFFEALANRSALLNEAQAAMDAGNAELYKSKFDEAVAMNDEISRLQAMIEESERFTDGLPAGLVDDSADVTEMAMHLRNGEKVTLDHDETMNVIRNAVNAAILTGTESLIQPSRANTTIHDNRNVVVSNVINLVSVQDLQGCVEWQEPYVKDVSTADKTKDGVAPTESTPTFRVSAVKPSLVESMAYVSRHIDKLNDAAYIEKVKTLAYDALYRKVVEYVIKGDGSTFFGILNAQNTLKEAICATYTVDAAAINEKTLRQLVFSSGGAETTGCGYLVLNKDDLVAFGDVRGTQDKKPVYTITPNSATRGNTGTIQEGGLVVNYVLSNQVKALSKAKKTSSPIQTMIYGDLSAYLLGIFSDFTVVVDGSYKFAEGLWSIRGEVMAGGNVTAHEALTIVNLAATA